jgi:curved DNA-binding protein CbpA
MGNTQSYNPAHVRIYTNLLSIQSVQTRADMIRTLLTAPEYIVASRQAGIYSYLLQYVMMAEKGRHPGLLPGERTSGAARQSVPTGTQMPGTLTVRQQGDNDPYTRLAKGKSQDKALSYFQMCLQVLGLEEEVALTEEELKKAYKKSAMKAHPDKGGSETAFEAVTRAYAYLTEILKRIHGGRNGPLKKVEAPNLLQTERTQNAESWKMSEPIRLNPDKLDMNAFNKMFEATRIPDPEEDGYGDWLKSESGAAGPKFSGKFNRDVFHKMFEDEAQKSRDKRQNQLAIASPQALYLAPTAGVELGRDKPADFTAPANAEQGLQYTDLRAAYTTENTFSGQVANVTVEARDLESYRSSRKKAPDPLRADEMEAIQAMEREAEARERNRQLRAAHEGMAADDFHERMKRLVITDGVPLDRKNRR